MRLICLALCFALLASPASAHFCLLTGTTNADIASYNACKNDLMMGLSGHDQAAEEDKDEDLRQLTAETLRQLKAENAELRAKLAQLRGQLLDLAKDL